MTDIQQLCDDCAPKVTRASVVLCGKCAQSFRVIYLPDDVRPWEEISRDAHGDNGVEPGEYMSGLLIRINHQQRELSRLNQQIKQLTVELRRAHHGARA
jgi:hypothetical protein